MLRMTLIEIVLFSLPFLLFFLYRTFILRHRMAEGDAFDPTPYHKLFILGGVLAFAGFLYLALHHKTYRDGEYIPAHLENGKVVRGRFVETPRGDNSPDASNDHEPPNPSGSKDN
ncbi:MAG: DUF6111 family protein [Robiginitomaculum sp.]|nr:DUF6111 family protein [Robiginitomaculum sp.]